MKLKRIEIRVPEEYNINCRKVQFYIHAKYKVLATLEQTDNEEDHVVFLGSDLLALNNLPFTATMHIYIIGITEKNEPFIFEPFQDMIEVKELNGFKFKNVRRIEDADRI